MCAYINFTSPSKVGSGTGYPLPAAVRAEKRGCESCIVESVHKVPALWLAQSAQTYILKTLLWGSKLLLKWRETKRNLI